MLVLFLCSTHFFVVASLVSRRLWLHWSSIARTTLMMHHTNEFYRKLVARSAHTEDHDCALSTNRLLIPMTAYVPVEVWYPPKLALGCLNVQVSYIAVELSPRIVMIAAEAGARGYKPGCLSRRRWCWAYRSLPTFCQRRCTSLSTVLQGPKYADVSQRRATS